MRAGVAFALALVASCGSETGEPDASAPTDSPELSASSALAPLRDAYRDKGVLIVAVDALRADRVGAYGYDRETTPFLDEFAAECVVFESAFAHAPETAASYMSLMTSALPSAHGVHASNGDGEFPQLDENRTTLAQALVADGFWTAAMVNGGEVRGRMGFRRGFGKAWYTTDGEMTALVSGTEDVVEKRPAKRRPFLFFQTHRASGPWIPPSEFRERFCSEPSALFEQRLVRLSSFSYTQVRSSGRDRYWRDFEEFTTDDVRTLSDLYDATIAYTDGKLAELFRALARLGFLDDVIVVVLANHGQEFGEHGRHENEQLFAENLRVPLMLRFPDGRWAGERVDGLVGLVDVAPTLLELLGVDVPEAMTGTSLVPALESGTSERATVVAERIWPGPYRAAMRSPDWSLHFDGEDGALVGYDLEGDAAERTPLAVDAATFGGAAALLREALEAAAGDDSRLAAWPTDE